MWNLKSPDISLVRDHLDTVFPTGAMPTIVTEKDKDALLSLYEAYRLALGHPSTELLGEKLSDELRQSILDAYKEVQDKGKLSLLRSTLKLLATECPYCGFGQIQDLDHHLPKAVYKPFSIFPLNLVPSCTTCNRGKTRKPSEDKEKHLINVYLEDVSTFHFLKAQVLFPLGNNGMQVLYEIICPDGMDKELHARLVNHFTEYDLHERYPAQVNIYLGEQEAAFELAFDTGGAEGLRAFLLRSANKNKERFGVNDWRTALLHGLAACNDFCEGGYIQALGYSAT